MKKINLSAILLFILMQPIFAQLKTAAYWTAPNTSEGLVEKLAKHDLLIIDYENLFNESRKNLEAIKKINPAIIFLIYSNPMEIWSKEMTDRPIANQLKNKFYPQWQLKDTKGKNVIFWQGMIMMNLTTKCPEIKQKNYGQYYADWLLQNILNDPLADGYFLDNGTATIAWISPLIDADNDGIADNPDNLNASWQAGMTAFLKKIRETKGDDFIIVTNKGIKDFFFVNNGVMFEKFPNDYIGHKEADGWYQSIENARRSGKYNIFQTDFSNLDFGIASSLLLDNVYVAVGQNIPFPENRLIKTGKPKGSFYKKEGKYYREYENGTVIVNPEKKTGEFR